MLTVERGALKRGGVHVVLRAAGEPGDPAECLSIRGEGAPSSVGAHLRIVVELCSWISCERVDAGVALRIVGVVRIPVLQMA